MWLISEGLLLKIQTDIYIYIYIYIYKEVAGLLNLSTYGYDPYVLKLSSPATSLTAPFL